MVFFGQNSEVKVSFFTNWAIEDDMLLLILANDIRMTTFDGFLPGQNIFATVPKFFDN